MVGKQLCGAGTNLQSLRFKTNLHEIKLNLINDDPQAATNLIVVRVPACACLPHQITVLTVTCVSPALSSVTCSASRAAAPYGPGERCTTATQTQTQLWKFRNMSATTSSHWRITSTLFTLHFMLPTDAINLRLASKIKCGVRTTT